MIDFVLPSNKDKEEVTSFYKEIKESNISCIGLNDFSSFSSWLEEMNSRKEGKNLRPGYVKENFYLCYLNKTLVGVFSFKFVLTPYLEEYGGHIGYAIRPSLRNKGLGTKILEEGLNIIKGFKTYKEVILIVDESNVASIKVIEKNKGQLISSYIDPYENVKIRKYLIKL